MAIEVTDNDDSLALLEVVECPGPIIPEYDTGDVKDSFTAIVVAVICGHLNGNCPTLQLLWVVHEVAFNTASSRPGKLRLGIVVIVASHFDLRFSMSCVS